MTCLSPVLISEITDLGPEPETCKETFTMGTLDKAFLLFLSHEVCRFGMRGGDGGAVGITMTTPTLPSPLFFPIVVAELCNPGRARGQRGNVASV